MFRRYALAALTFAAVACSSDSSESGTDNKDAAVAADTGTAAPVAVPGKSTSVGEPCTTAADCGGSASTCLTKQSPPTGGSITFAGGYCSAQCVANSECAAAGTASPDGCPLSSLVDGSNQLTSAFSSFLKPLAVCLKPCKSDADCRGAGYKCDMIATQLTSALPAGSEAIAGAITGGLPKTSYCLSTDIMAPPAPDAGAAVDGGASDAGATDAGATDAGVDAGASDAAVDSGATDAGVDAGPDATT